MKLKFSIKSFLFSAFLGWMISTVWLSHIPGDPKNAWVFGLSVYRFVMLAAAGILSLVFLALWVGSLKNPKWDQQTRRKIAASLRVNDRAIYGIVIALTGSVGGFGIILFTRQMTGHAYQAALVRIAPLIFGFSLLFLLALILLLFGDLGTDSQADETAKKTAETGRRFEINTCVGVVQISRQAENILIGSVGVILALLIRIPMLEYVSGDIEKHFGVWVDFIRANDGLLALEHDFSNYTPIYLYLMTIFNIFGLSTVVTIKLVSIVFDFICGYFVYKIVRLKFPDGAIPLFAFLLTLFLPTVFINSSYWGQNDSIYTSGLLGFTYFLLKKREIPALIAFGFSFAVKLQSIALAPLLLILLLYNRIKFRSLILIPAVYFVSILPAWMVGRPLSELLTIYVVQAGQGSKLSHGAANLFEWIPELPAELFADLLPTSLLWAAAAIFLFSAAVYKCRFRLDAGILIKLATISTLLVPFLVPEMHERYFYPADIFSLILGFFWPNLFFIPILVQITSGFSYYPNFFQGVWGLEKYLGFIQLFILVFLIRDLALLWLSQRPSRATPTQDS